MSIEKVKEYFAEYGREDDILEFDQSSATVELAAQAANVIPARIAKTLSFKNKAGDNAIFFYRVSKFIIYIFNSFFSKSRL